MDSSMYGTTTLASTAAFSHQVPVLSTLLVSVCGTPQSTVRPHFICSVTVWGVCRVWAICRALMIRMWFVCRCFAHALCVHWELSICTLHCMWDENLWAGWASRVFHGHTGPYHGRVASVPPQPCIQTWKAPGQSTIPQSRGSKWGQQSIASWNGSSRSWKCVETLQFVYKSQL